MNDPRNLWILAGITGAVVVAAVVAVLDQRALTFVPTDRARAFPALPDNVNDVASVTIESNEAKFTIIRTEKGWGLEEKGNYPVHFDKVKGAIVGLSELRLLEAKTSDPKRYDRLDLQDPKEKEAKSIRVSLRDEGGTVLAAGIIGKRNPDLFGGSGGGTYIRRGEDAQSWLTEGEVELGAEPNDWLIRDIVNIEAEHVARAVLRQPDGAEITVTRADKKAKDYVVSGIPKGRKLKNADEGRNLSGGLWRLSFEDVKPAHELDFADKPYVAEYETFDGLKVRVEMTMIDKVVWGRFTASAENAKGDDKAKEALRKKAKEISERARGWVYELSPGEGEKLTTKIEDILEKPKGA